MRLPLLALAAAVAAFALVPAGNGARAGVTYYVSRHGNDNATGRSPAAAWRSLAQVDRTPLGAGDRVLFHGGDRFAGVLEPSYSGSPNRPITFGTYGTGRASIGSGIRLSSVSWLVFDRLQVDTGSWRTAGTTVGVRTSTAGYGVAQIVIRDCRFANLDLGLVLASHNDANWTVTHTTVANTRDSGILIFDPTQPHEIGPSHLLFSDDTVVHTGLDRRIPWKKHAVYDIGRDTVWRNDVIRDFSEGGFSLRASGSTLVGNTIARGQYGVYFAPYDPAGGHTRIERNRISSIAVDAIGVSSSAAVRNAESFVIAGNSIRAFGRATGIHVVGTSGSVAIADNRIATEYGAPLLVDTRPGRGLVETGNVVSRPRG